MKKKFLATMLVLTMSSFVFAGCGNQEAPVAESTEDTSAEENPVEETVEEEPEEAAEDTEDTEDTVEETSDNDSEDAKSAEDTSAESTEERNIEVYVDDEGPEPIEILSYDENNEYVKKIREAYDIPEDIYPGASIHIDSEGRAIFFFEPEGNEDYVSNDQYWFTGLPGKDNLSSDLDDAGWEEVGNELSKGNISYYDKVRSGELDPLDLDEDGKISLWETVYCSFFTEYDLVDKHILGEFWIPAEDAFEEQNW